MLDLGEDLGFMFGVILFECDGVLDFEFYYKFFENVEFASFRLFVKVKVLLKLKGELL